MKRHLFIGWIVVVLTGTLAARAQINNFAGSQTLVGTVQLDGNQPASGIKIDLRSVTGDAVDTVFTRLGGEFQVQAPGGTYVVAVQVFGYEPIEQIVQVNGGAPQHLWLYLKKKTPEPDIAPDERYAVSVHELTTPGKARKEYEKGLKQLAKNDAVGSLDHFQRAVEAFPNYYEAYYQIALARIALGHKEDAEQALRKSIELSGENFSPPQLTLGLLLCERQQYDEAEGMMRKVLGKNPNSWGAHFVLARVMLGTNRLVEADRNAHQAVDRRPDFALAHLLMANIRVRTRDYDTGLRELDTFLALEPNTPLSAEVRKFRGTVEQLAGGQTTAGGKLEQSFESPVSASDSDRKPPE